MLCEQGSSLSTVPVQSQFSLLIDGLLSVYKVICRLWKITAHKHSFMLHVHCFQHRLYHDIFVAYEFYIVSANAINLSTRPNWYRDRPVASSLVLWLVWAGTIGQQEVVKCYAWRYSLVLSWVKVGYSRTIWRTTMLGSITWPLNCYRSLNPFIFFKEKHVVTGHTTFIRQHMKFMFGR